MDLVCFLEVYLEEVMPGPLSAEEATQPVEEEHEETRVHEQVRDSDEPEGGEGEHSDIADTNDNVEEDEAQDEDEDEAEKEQDKEEQENKEEDQEEDEKTDEFEESTVRTRPSRRRRWFVASDDEDSSKALDRNSRLTADLQQTEKAAAVGDPQHSVPSAENQLITARAQDTPHVSGESLPSATQVCVTTKYIDTERPIKKEKEIPPAYRVRVPSVAGSSQEGPALFKAHRPLGSAHSSLSSDISHNSIRPTC